MTRYFKILYIIFFLPIFYCYNGHGLSPTATELGSGIRGRITFVGTWPDSTKEVMIIVSKKYPKGITSRDSMLAFVAENLLLKNIILADTIPNFIKDYDYRIPLEPGKYEWILVAWFPDIPEYIMGVKEIGAYYENPGRQTLPSTFEVLTGVFIEGFNIVADFQNVKHEIPFFKIFNKRKL
jgi:hypothetical protein